MILLTGKQSSGSNTSNASMRKIGCHVKRIASLALVFATLFTMTACRSRTTAAELPEPLISGIESEQTVPDPSAAPESAQDATQQISEPLTSEELPPDADAPTEEDASSKRKEYSETADAELTPDAGNTVTAPSPDAADAPVLPAPDSDAVGEAGGNMESDQGDQTVTETVPADEAEKLGAAENAPVADTILLYYQTLLYDRLSSLFECQKLYVYWETEADYTTVFKTSAEHQLILDAGAYDVSAKLLEENLTVAPDWIQNKNPGMIVKVVAPDILGSGVQGSASAQSIRDAMLAREGSAATDAEKNGRVLIISSSLLTSQARRTAAAVYLAKAIYPTLFEDVDPAEALRLLTEEADGAAASGLFAYTG